MEFIPVVVSLVLVALLIFVDRLLRRANKNCDNLIEIAKKWEEVSGTWMKLAQDNGKEAERLLVLCDKIAKTRDEALALLNKVA